jgi:hypothetical protein
VSICKTCRAYCSVNQLLGSQALNWMIMGNR